MMLATAGFHWLALLVFIMVEDQGQAQRGNCVYYCDVNQIATNGAKAATARQDRLQPGVAASHAMADRDLRALEKYRDCFKRVGREYGIQPAVIAAIASRESRGGTALKNGWGDDRKGWGLTQCDTGTSGLGAECRRLPWDSCSLVELTMRRVLVPFIQQVTRDHPTWTRCQKFKGGIAAYNFGPSNVQTLGGMDQGTTGDDYSDDVAARAQRISQKPGWGC